MAYFPDKQAVKTELQEKSNQFDLSCMHLTTCNFFEPNVGYIRDNTTREKWVGNTGVFARPLPLQMPVMGQATLKLKSYFVPYRTISPQWHNFITRSPHIPANITTQINVQEMPYFTMSTLQNLFKTSDYAGQTTGSIWDFRDYNGDKYILTAKGRHCLKILHQLGYKITWGTPPKDEKHINALRILAFAKVYCDYYYSNQYAYVTIQSVQVEALFTKDDITPYRLIEQDFENIFDLTRYAFYDDDYFVSQWDNPVSPNNVTTSFGNITMQDITAIGTDVQVGSVDVYSNASENKGGTPYLTQTYLKNSGTNILTQYAIDSLKKCSDYVHRYSLSGIRSVDRYLARFGVLLTTEKLRRSEYYGEQKTLMQFGAVMSTAETTQGQVGDYAGQGIINSDGQEHNTFEMNDLKDMGCIIEIFTIIPRIGYCQGINRNNLRSDPESYFNGIFDALGTQATSAAEIYISEDGTTPYSTEQQIDDIWGYIARGAHNKLALDNCSGDFMVNSMNGGNYKDNPWHLFRMFEDSYFANQGGGVTHTPYFVQAWDAEQYLRIFDAKNEDAGDHFVVLLQHSIDARIHARPIWDTYDFESEGERIIMNGMGPKQN